MAPRESRAGAVLILAVAGLSCGEGECWDCKVALVNLAKLGPAALARDARAQSGLGLGPVLTATEHECGGDDEDEARAQNRSQAAAQMRPPVGSGNSSGRSGRKGVLGIGLVGRSRGKLRETDQRRKLGNFDLPAVEEPSPIRRE